MLDGIAAKAVDSFQDARSAWSNAGIDEQLTVIAGQNCDIAAGAFDDRDIAAQLVKLDGRLRGRGSDRIDDVARLGESFGRGQPGTIRAEAGGDGAAYAKAAS